MSRRNLIVRLWSILFFSRFSFLSLDEARVSTYCFVRLAVCSRETTARHEEIDEEKAENIKLIFISCTILFASLYTILLFCFRWFIDNQWWLEKRKIHIYILKRINSKNKRMSWIVTCVRIKSYAHTKFDSDWRFFYI